MIVNFELLTKWLTDFEIELLPIIAQALSRKKGKAQAITNEAMCKGLWDKMKVKVTPARIRKIINFIRNHDLVKGLIATSDGYYVSRDPEELISYIDSLDGRESAIGAIKGKICEYLKELVNLNPNVKPAFTNTQTEELYSFIRERVSADQLPDYTAGLIGNLTYCISVNNYYSYIVRHPEFVIALIEYFRFKEDLIRVDIISGQYSRAKGEFETFPITPTK